jgi:hypothetical protein
MIYRITVRSNPRILIVAALVVVGPAVGIASFFFSPPIIAIILTAVGAFFSYAFGKFLRQTLRSRIETTEAGLSFDSGAGDRSFFAWEDITLAGRYAEAKNKEYLFIYKENGDRLITVPDEYERFPQLIAAVAERREVEEITLESGETLTERLRKRFSPQETAES